MRQSKVEEKILEERGRSTVHPTTGNVQQTGGQQPSWNNKTWKRNWVPREGWQNQRRVTLRLIGEERGPGTMVIDKRQAGEDWRCFNCRGFGHMAQNCNSRRTVERNRRMIQVDNGEELKDNGDSKLPLALQQ